MSADARARTPASNFVDQLGKAKETDREEILSRDRMAGRDASMVAKVDANGHNGGSAYGGDGGSRDTEPDQLETEAGSHGVELGELKVKAKHPLALAARAALCVRAALAGSLSSNAQERCLAFTCA